MNNIVYTEVPKLHRLIFTQEFFADYLTALLPRIRLCPECEAILTGKQPHPLLAIQTGNQQQLQTLNIAFIPAALLNFDPFRPTENFIVQVNTRSDHDPKLDNGWDAFLQAWKSYKERLAAGMFPKCGF